jgi:hypothetical protein
MKRDLAGCIFCSAIVLASETRLAKSRRVSTFEAKAAS